MEVDGELVTELGTRVDPKRQQVRVDGIPVWINPNHVTLALNKPRKVLSTMDDPKGRFTLRDIVGDKYERIFHMGRLDYDSEGLILMTNDGELSQHVMHPRYEVAKTYIATLEGRISGTVCRRLVSQGVQLDDGWIKLDHCAILDSSRDTTLVKVVLHSGKNRVVRRIFGAVGFPVKRLVRTQIGPIKLGDIKPGSYRVLSQTEVRSLSKEVGLSIRVAIDGPAGVGKSSTSKALARYFGFAYLDTGAMYRACAWWCMRQSIDLDAEQVDEQLVTETVGEFFTEGHFDISVDPADPKVLADGEDISDAIRASEVSSHVSKVSNIIPVRHVLIAAQRAYIAREAAEDSFSGGAGIVAEGRDITTVVAPDAEVRVLLTAREEVRQARRTGQAVKGVGGEDVAARDRADSKVTSFLEAADGVITVDNSDMDFDETLAVLVRMVEDAIEEQEYERYAANLTGYELDEGDEALIDGSAFDDRSETYTPKAVGVLAIVGRPNVGKSTLVNRVLGRRAAVVEDTPGVTRDRVSYDAEWAGTDFKLVDTGGWEADVEGIDSAIASQAQIAVQLADAVVLVVDGQVGMTATDERIVKMLRASGKPVTLAVNKVDDRESEYMAAEFWKLGLGEPYPISAMHGRGVGDLLDAALDNLKKAEKTSGFLTPSHLRRVALVGRPNVGKSSLLNQLAHEQRAVVHDMAGTTRDPVDEIVNVDGEDWLFIDTAGIKRRLHKVSGADYYSSLRTQAAIERAELALVLFDASQPISDSVPEGHEPGRGRRTCNRAGVQQVGRDGRVRQAASGTPVDHRIRPCDLGAAREPVGQDRLAYEPSGLGHAQGVGVLGSARAHRQAQRVPGPRAGRAPASAAGRQAAAHPVRHAGLEPPAAVRDLRHRVPGARLPPVSGTLAARGVRLRGHPDPDLGEHPREEAPQVAPGPRDAPRFGLHEFRGKLSSCAKAQFGP